MNLLSASWAWTLLLVECPLFCHEKMRWYGAAVGAHNKRRKVKASCLAAALLLIVSVKWNTLFEKMQHIGDESVLCCNFHGVPFSHSTDTECSSKPRRAPRDVYRTRSESRAVFLRCLPPRSDEDLSLRSFPVPRLRSDRSESIRKICC